MNKETYQSLIDCRFISKEFGYVHGYSGNSCPFYKYADVSAKLYKQMEEEIDPKNIVIMFPLGTNYGDNGFYGPGDNQHNSRKVLIDHCTYFLDVSSALDKFGVVFKNGKKLTDEKYTQMRIAMLIVQNGKAYAVDSSANPWSNNLTYNQSASFNENPLYNHAEIKLDDKDVRSRKNKIDPTNKNVMFSGFFVRRMKDAKIIG